MNTDAKSFLAWNLSWPALFESGFFYFRKAMLRFFADERKFGLRNYPVELRTLLAKGSGAADAGHWPLCVAEKAPRLASAERFSRLALAGSQLMVDENQNILWNQPYQDPEDTESLHRMNWLVHLLMDEGIADDEKANWGLFQIHRWHSLQAGIDESSLAWQSYTVAERIANISAFHQALGLAMSPDVMKSLVIQASFLVPRFEFYPGGFGNHVVNNSRGVLIAGCLSGQRHLTDAALAVLLAVLPDLVSARGFLNEGSSHYQFIFTRWLLEMRFYLRLSGHANGERFLDAYVRRCLDACRFFVVRTAEGKRTIPLFGDISPDFSPDFMLRWPESRSGRLFFGDEEPWECADSQDLCVDDRDGWVRAHVLNDVVFLRCADHSLPREFNHHHNDFFSFCYSRDGEKIIVDTGRPGYADNPINHAALRAHAHNSLLIDGQAETPENWRRYPRSFSRARHMLQKSVHSEDLKLKVGTNGFRRLGVERVNRILTLKPNGLDVHDEIISNRSEMKVQTYFHFGEGVELEALANQTFRISIGRCRGTFRISGHDISITCFHGIDEKNPGLGALSTAYGVQKATHALKIEFVWPRVKPIYSFEWENQECAE